MDEAASLRINGQIRQQDLLFRWGDENELEQAHSRLQSFF